MEQELEKIVLKIKDVTGVDIRTRNRTRHIVNAKKIYCHVARQKGYTFSQIAKQISINHATVMWHCSDAEYLFRQDKKFFNDYLRVQGKPTEGKCERDYFDLNIARYYKREFEV